MKVAEKEKIIDALEKIIAHNYFILGGEVDKCSESIYQQVILPLIKAIDHLQDDKKS